MKKLLLIDGNNVVYRAFFALPMLNNHQGRPTNAVYGFTTMLTKVIAEEQPTHLLVAFDAGKMTFRHNVYAEYKGGRQKTPPELSQQFPLVFRMLEAMHVKYYALDQYEADDIVGTLSRQAAQEGFDVTIVTGDRDYLQLVDDRVTVSLIKKGVSDTESYDRDHVYSRYGISPEAFIDLKGLMGDASDNIPGVPGVGEKTAMKLIGQYGSIEAVYAHLDDISAKKLHENLAEHREQALMSKQIATINCKSPLALKAADCAFSIETPPELIAFFRELGFQSLIDKYGSSGGAAADTPAQASENEVISVNRFTAPDSSQPAALLVERLEPNYHRAAIVGFAVASPAGIFASAGEDALRDAAFARWLEAADNRKILLESKAAEVALRRRGISLKGIAFDAQLAAYLIDPSEAGQELAVLAEKRGIAGVESDEHFYGKGAKQTIPDSPAFERHLAAKAAALLKLYPLLEQELEANEQKELLYGLELPLARVLAKMEISGVSASARTLADMGTELDRTIAALETDIYQMAGVTFNINSTKQLGEILFEKLQLPPVKKTKTGYSTAADVLEKLRGRHEIIERILDFRQLIKLKSTYVEGLLKVIDPVDHKIHTCFNQALTQTGRLSSVDPNLQNIPIRLEEGRKIRQAFLPSERGWQIFSADYSQIELRVLAHISGDVNLRRAFIEKMDIHTKTAMDVFGAKANEVTALMRRQAKAVNFGIIYGISDYGLSQNIGISRKEAAEFIEKYLKSYPGVQAYMKDIVSKARQDGYVTTLLNRRRYLPDLHSHNFNQRSFAERTAMNTPIQGSAADVIKQAMIAIDARLADEGLQARMLLQVHDELIFEVPEAELPRLEQLVPEVMEHAVPLEVPLEVHCAWGPTWYDAK
ncbi:MAG: DNA polymerase I [Sporolactobacillus sp.]